MDPNSRRWLGCLALCGAFINSKELIFSAEIFYNFHKIIFSWIHLSGVGPHGACYCSPGCLEHNSLPMGIFTGKQSKSATDHAKHSWRDPWWVPEPRTANPQGDCQHVGNAKSAQSETGRSAEPMKSLSRNLNYIYREKMIGWISQKYHKRK